MRDALDGLVASLDENAGVIVAGLEAPEHLVDMLHADRSLAEDGAVSHTELRTRLASDVVEGA